MKRLKEKKQQKELKNWVVLVYIHTMIQDRLYTCLVPLMKNLKNYYLMKMMSMKRNLKMMSMERNLKMMSMERNLKMMSMKRNLKMMSMMRNLKMMSMMRNLKMMGNLYMMSTGNGIRVQHITIRRQHLALGGMWVRELIVKNTFMKECKLQMVGL